MDTALRSPPPPADRRDHLPGTALAGSRSTRLVLQFYLPLQTPVGVNLPEAVPVRSPQPGQPQTGSAQGGLGQSRGTVGRTSQGGPSLVHSPSFKLIKLLFLCVLGLFLSLMEMSSWE